MSTFSALASELLARLPTMTDEERRLGLEVYRQLARGEPVLRISLAEALDHPTHDVDELLGHPNLKSLTHTDNNGRIIGFGGLAVREMPHRFRIDGRTLYTWCAWDSLLIPVILGLEAEVESSAPGSTVCVRLRVSPDGVKRVQPPSAVMSFLLPTAQTFQADVLKAMASFCHFIFSFRIASLPRSGRNAIPIARSSPCQMPSNSAAGWLAHGGVQRSYRGDRA